MHPRWWTGPRGGLSPDTAARHPSPNGGPARARPGPAARRRLSVGALSGDRFAEVEVTSVAELHEWLQCHHGRPDGVWLVTYRKAAGDRHVPHDAVLDELTAFGWCDGGMRRVDDLRTRQQISPRRTRAWARSYRDRAERLIAEGRMQPAGQAAVDLARRTGQWDAMNDVDDLVVPPDLQSALDLQPPAAHSFAGFPPSTRRNILRWIAAARTPQTRTRRIDRVATDASSGVRTPTNG